MKQARDDAFSHVQVLVGGIFDTVHEDIALLRVPMQVHVQQNLRRENVKRSRSDRTKRPSMTMEGRDRRAGFVYPVRKYLKALPEGAFDSEAWGDIFMAGVFIRYGMVAVQRKGRGRSLIGRALED